MSFVITLPSDLGTTLFNDWLILKEIGKLDLAICNSELRVDFLQILCNNAVQICAEDCNYLPLWISKREIKLKELLFRSSKFESWREVDFSGISKIIIENIGIDLSLESFTVIVNSCTKLESFICLCLTEFSSDLLMHVKSEIWANLKHLELDQDVQRKILPHYNAQINESILCTGLLVELKLNYTVQSQEMFANLLAHNPNLRKLHLTFCDTIPLAGESASMEPILLCKHLTDIHLEGKFICDVYIIVKILLSSGILRQIVVITNLSYFHSSNYNGRTVHFYVYPGFSYDFPLNYFFKHVSNWLSVECRQLTGFNDNELVLVANNSPNLQHLHYHENGKFSLQGLKYVLRQCSKLTRLSIHDCNTVSQELLSDLLCTTTTLQSLRLCRCFIQKQGLIVEILKHNVQLIELELSNWNPKDKEEIDLYLNHTKRCLDFSFLPMK
jgi:hypothetical protein